MLNGASDNVSLIVFIISGLGDTTDGGAGRRIGSVGIDGNDEGEDKPPRMDEPSIAWILCLNNHKLSIDVPKRHTPKTALSDAVVMKVSIVSIFMFRND